MKKHFNKVLREIDEWEDKHGNVDILSPVPLPKWLEPKRKKK